MDLLDRVNALTDDQLRMIADRDDASGVLASYRLAELRGLPYPDREAVILCDGYVIVAQHGHIMKVPTNGEDAVVAKIIREQDGQYCVYSEDGSRSFGCYDSMAAAEHRLQQVHWFDTQDETLLAAPGDVRDGTYVSWNSSGGRARGQVERVVREGALDVPGSSFTINAEPDDPAALIRVWRQFADGWRETDTLVGHKVSTLTVIDALRQVPTKRENGLDFPAAAYAYVPDPLEPARWAMRVWESPETRETREQIGRALAELDSVRIPASDVETARAGIQRALERLRQREDSAQTQLSKETFVPPEGVQQAAQRALDWIAEGHAGGGFTDVGRARAAQLARGDGVSETTIRRIANYLSRHQGDARAEGFSAGEDGFPSPGRVAWDAWGGDPAVSWATSIVERLNREQDKNGDMPLTPRQRMMYDKFEWIAETLGPWDGGVGPDGAHYMAPSDNPFAAEGLNCANCVFYLGGGGCEILDMPVEANGVCKLWIIPERALEVQADTGHAKAISRDGRFLQKEAAQRFTLGPLYVPDFMDAHGEWTDADELQQAVWGWVQSGNRTIYLQHDREVRAGEWVEVMTMPQPWPVTMMGGDGTPVGEVTYPAGTVFLGVIWDEEPWRDIVAGNLRGYSIGGFSDRVLADLPTDGSREGVSLDE